jgi:N-carbamoyl-L-amino-acid hydrolase
MQAGPLIDGDRMKADFDALSKIGSTGDGGVHRPTFSEAHLQARSWFLDTATRSGLETRVDPAGNHSAVLAMPGATRTLLVGSHLDSVPKGGRFDGGLGVVAALEVLRNVRDAQVELPVSLEAIDFTDEEGTFVARLGSAALTGSLAAANFEDPRGGRDKLLAGLERAGLSEAGILAARRDPAELAGYLEMHIEQGPRLATSHTDIGIVTGIVGIASYQVMFHGEANHAGTTPMPDRCDAGLGASAFVVAAHHLVRNRYPDSVVNFGRAEFNSGAYNIIPDHALLHLQFRSPDHSTFVRLDEELRTEAHRAARQFGLRVELRAGPKWNPVEMNQQVQSAFQHAADSLDLSHQRMPSGGGHDADKLVQVTRAGMIFIPSPNGISHDPREYSEWRDCENGANVLLRAAVDLARNSKMR